MKIRFCFVLCAALLIAVPPLQGQNPFSETAVVLQALYEDETLAFHRYSEYAKKAVEENYPNTAQLFKAFAVSESVHARNFRAALFSLRAEAKEPPKVSIEVLDTKENLRRSCQTELDEIESKYPQFLERVRPENNETAMKVITFAWESEKQHEKLIQRIQSGTGFLFRFLAKRIEGKPGEYFVCQNCGSTRMKLPPETCPICSGSPERYVKIETGK